MSDVDMLARIIEAEAAAEPIKGKVAVGAVIDNRRQSGRYGEGWRGVITKPGQFSAINDVTGYANGLGANQVFWREPSNESRRVAALVMSGQYQDPTNGATHYFNPKAADPKWARGKQFRPIGNHVFGNADAGADKLRGGQEKDTLSNALSSGKVSQEQLFQEAVRRGLIDRGQLEAEAKRRGLLQDEAPEQPQQEVMPPQAEGGAAPQDSGVPGIVNAIGDGAMLGFSDNVGAFMDAVADEAVQALGLSPDDQKTFKEAYRASLERRRGDMSSFAEQNPNTDLAARVGGGLATAGGLVRSGATLMGRTTSTAGNVAGGAIEGAAYGAAIGAGEGNEEALTGARDGAIGGAIVGGALARAGVSFERYLNARAAQRAAPSSEQLKGQASELFKLADQSGIIYRPAPVVDMVDDLGVQMIAEGIDKQLHPKAARAMKRLGELTSKPATLGEMERYRKIASAAAFEAKPGSADQRLALMIRDAIDDFTLDQSNMIAPEAGASLQAEARKLWSQFRKDELVANQVEKAVRRAASTGSGGNENNAIRQNIRAILDNKKLIKGFTAEERAAMEEIVRGGPVDGMLRLVGKLSPSGNGLMMALNLGATVPTAGASLAVSALATGAKSLADGATTKRVAALAALIRSGGRAPRSRIAQLTQAERKALANLVSAEAGVPIGGPVADAIPSAP